MTKIRASSLCDQNHPLGLDQTPLSTLEKNPLRLFFLCVSSFARHSASARKRLFWCGGMVWKNTKKQLVDKKIHVGCSENILVHAQIHQVVSKKNEEPFGG